MTSSLGRTKGSILFHALTLLFLSLPCGPDMTQIRLSKKREAFLWTPLELLSTALVLSLELKAYINSLKDTFEPLPKDFLVFRK